MVGLFPSLANAQIIDPDKATPEQKRVMLSAIMEGICVQNQIEANTSIGVTVLTSDVEKFKTKCKDYGAAMLKAQEIEEAKKAADEAKDKAAWQASIDSGARNAASHSKRYVYPLIANFPEKTW
jgi:hypothetical protein